MAVLSSPAPPRERADRCPGVLRPWPAADGGLVRVRVVAGRLTTAQLAGLTQLSREYGDGDLHLTTRANVQLRGVRLPVPSSLVLRLADLGLLPSLAHDRVRNVLVSPLTGRVGGRADLRPVAARLDALLLAEPVLAELPGRFLFRLDDRGDLADRPADLAAVALSADRARLVAGGWDGPEVDLAEVPDRLLGLAKRFLDLRGDGPSAAWHVHELPGGPASLGAFTAPGTAAGAAPGPTRRTPYGRSRQDDGRWMEHLAVPDGVLTPILQGLVLGAAGGGVVVTPWRSVLLPDLEEAR